MSLFIKKIAENKKDEMVHNQFQKFSKGEFRDRAIVEVKKTGDKYSIGTSYEYVNELVKLVAESLMKNQKVAVEGAIVSTKDLTGEIEFKEKKQFQGVKRYLIETEMTKEEIINLCNKFPKSFIAISFNSNDTILKIKAKAPKSGKASNKENEGPKADFCKIKTSNKELVKEFLFDVNQDFKRVIVNHTFLITEIEIPQNEKDPAIMREKAIRKGKIIRKINIDGKETVKEIKFEA